MTDNIAMTDLAHRVVDSVLGRSDGFTEAERNFALAALRLVMADHDVAPNVPRAV